MWAVTSLWPQKVGCKSQIYSVRTKLMLISDQARELVKNCIEGRPLCVPFKMAHLHPGSCINRLSKESLHVTIYVEKVRVFERERELFGDISPVLSLETLCLVGCG